jgi:hypothetical protein
MRYDMPLVSVAKFGSSRHFLCLNIDGTDAYHKFLVVEPTADLFDAFLRERVDLRFMFSVRRVKHYLAQGAGEVGEVAELQRYKGEVDQWLPESGLFLRDYKGSLLSHGGKLVERQVNLDGRWGIEDLERFSDLWSDAYAFTFALYPQLGGNKQRITELFHKYPWRGGFSAMNFFGDLYRQVPPGLRPAISEMHKASPGYLKMALHEVLFDRIEHLVKNLNSRNSPESLAYDQVRKDLRESGWLGRASADIRLGGDDLERLQQHLKFLSKAFGFVQQERHILYLGNQDPLAAVKILLSFYRKVRELSDYISTGKATF